jgi:rod shape-determining protein MreC
MKSSAPRPWQTIVILLAVVGLLVLALGGYLTPITKTLLSPILSIQNWLYTRFQAFQDLISAPSDVEQLRQRNLELEAEVVDLQTQIINLQQQVTEVEILSALLDFARAQPENKYQAAAVVALDPSPFMQYVIINRGSDDGLRRGMPVVSDQGLVGRIDAVSANAARVQLITDPSSALNITIQPSNTEAVLLGSITGNLNLDMIPQNANIQAGDLVLTSGLGGNYPPNILIGQITGVREEATELFKTASVQAVVDFARLEIVLVIVNFQPIDIAPLIPEPTPLP